MYDLNARYYDAKIARFLSPDPYYDLGNRVIGLYEINVPDALSIILANSLYAYCVNRPNNLYDHTGLDPIPKWAIRIKYGGATDEDYAKAKLISSSGKDSAWAGSAGYIVRYAIEKANHLSSKITKLDKKGLNMIANRERSLSSVKIDDNNNITSIPIIGNDVGYGFDISVNNLPTGFVAGDLTPEQAYELLIISTNSFSSAISDSFDINLNQDQFNALVLLKYNIGYLSNINGLMDYIESGNYDRIKMESMINGYYDSLIDSNPENERYRIGWYNRTKTMLDIFFDGDYGSMPIDAEKGKVYP